MTICYINIIKATLIFKLHTSLTVIKNNTYLIFSFLKEYSEKGPAEMQGEACLCRRTVPCAAGHGVPPRSCLQKVELEDACAIFFGTADKQGRKGSAEQEWDIV